MRRNLTALVVATLILSVLAGALSQLARSRRNIPYHPTINPTDFTPQITHPLFSLPVGQTTAYTAETPEGSEKVEIVIEPPTRTIMGVLTLTYHDRVYLDNQLVEDTRDYLAQDKEGNVWYFGEEVDNYEDGILVDHDGSFIAGEGGAEPGIWIKADSRVGDSYRQEYLPGVAEDMRDVVAVDQTVTIAQGTYHGCVQFYDWTPLEPDSREHKYYCPQIANQVLTKNLTTGVETALMLQSN